MQPQPVIISPVVFGYKHPLKTLYKNGQLRQVKYGFYGDKLTKDNVTLEHLQPVSKGGQTKFYNLVLASENNNHRRDNINLKNFITTENVIRYLNQFIGIDIEGFNGNRYIIEILETLEKLLGSKNK